MFFMYTCYQNELWTIDVHFPNSHIMAMVHLEVGMSCSAGQAVSVF